MLNTTLQYIANVKNAESYCVNILTFATHCRTEMDHANSTPNYVEFLQQFADINEDATQLFYL